KAHKRGEGEITAVRQPFADAGFQNEPVGTHETAGLISNRVGQGPRTLNIELPTSKVAVAYAMFDVRLSNYPAACSAIAASTGALFVVVNISAIASSSGRSCTPTSSSA